MRLATNAVPAGEDARRRRHSLASAMSTHLLAWVVITMWLLAVGQPGFKQLKLLISW